MQRRWTGKNVDLDLLSECIEDFFRDRGFLTKRTESEGEHTILWTSERAAKNVKRAMTATIVGVSNDFIIEILASELTRRSVQLGLLSKIFGGGRLALRGLRLQEALEKLEREFWVYIEGKVTHLAGSAEHR